MKRRENKQVTAIITALPDMSLSELREEWRRRYEAPPRHRSAELLRRVLAWRIQADVYGGFDAATRRMLERDDRAKMAPASGMRLAREWAGKRHEVEIVDGGVLYHGEIYKSLSQVARHITGIRWNGPRFFGLRQENVR